MNAQLRELIGIVFRYGQEVGACDTGNSEVKNNTYLQHEALRNQIEARIAAYERALSAIAELPFVTEETPWTWKDISTEQTKIARIALEDGIYQEVDA